MKRISVMVLAAGAVALTLTACGGSDDSGDASGLRKGGSVTSSAATSTPQSGNADAPAATASAAPIDTAKLGTASRTSCADFKALDSTAQKTLVEQILQENPDSSFAGSPNVALGTAKLVCLASSNASKPVAVAAGIVTQK
ncbi:hypothetical protein [Nocardia goodfellowii]|uniref:Component of type VI protein secretion system n=1 Tax=Nocardia goodfellowii TaxID=882446 RepID=A0ABS4QAN9_9NOCA|nr:hypothetical protein [Nocardia goodfellowii]MBP2188638.1 putative component of type VI protein secretion system [Nocardia goodfellowii]